MQFLEYTLMNVLIVVICMFIDRYALKDVCRNNPICEGVFKTWLVGTFFTVGWYLIRSFTKVENAVASGLAGVL